MRGSFPGLVALEVTTRCNLKCVMCPHGIGAIAQPRDADPDVVSALLPAIMQAETVHLNGVGEPMLSETFWSLIDLLKGRKGPKIDFNTNGLLLTDRNIARLSGAPLGTVLVSFDAARADTYRRIRGGAFDKLVDGTRRLVSTLSDCAQIKGTFVVMRENIGEMTAFVDLARDMGLKSVWFGTLTDPAISRDTWVVERASGWQFRYSEQMLARDSEELRNAVRAARIHGEALGIAVDGMDMWQWGSV